MQKAAGGPLPWRSAILEVRSPQRTMESQFAFSTLYSVR